MTFHRTTMFWCKRCGALKPRNMKIRKQSYCLECVQRRSKSFRTGGGRTWRGDK